jgi:hypothetical protein
MPLRWSGDYDSFGAEQKRGEERDEMLMKASSAEPSQQRAAASTLLRLLPS